MKLYKIKFHTHTHAKMVILTRNKDEITCYKAELRKMQSSSLSSADYSMKRTAFSSNMKRINCKNKLVLTKKIAPNFSRKKEKGLLNLGKILRSEKGDGLFFHKIQESSSLSLINS